MNAHFSRDLARTLTDEIIQSRITDSFFSNFADEKISVKVLHGIQLFKLPDWKYQWIDIAGNYAWCDFHWAWNGKAYSPCGHRWKKISKNKCGRRHTSILEDSVGGVKTIAPLVARIVYGPRPEKMEVLHAQDDVSTDHFSKIWYGFHKENAEDAVRNERMEYGEFRYNAKLTDEKVRECRRRFDAKEAGSYALAKECGVSNATMLPILRRESWKHVT